MGEISLSFGDTAFPTVSPKSTPSNVMGGNEYFSISQKRVIE